MIKKVMEIGYASQEQIKKRKVPEVPTVLIAEDTSLINLKVEVNLLGSYFPDKSKKYHSVVLSDEELKGLEEKRNKMTDRQIINVKKRLEELSSAYKQMCEMGINSPETCIAEIHRYNTFSIAVEKSYEIFCEELNIPYEPLNQPRLEWSVKG